MKCLYRFEDKYGSAVIFKRLGGCEEAEVETGLRNDGCFFINENRIRKIVKSGVDNIVSVFDLDTETAAVDKIIDNNTLADRMDSLEYKLRSYGYTGKIEYLPTVYAAETVMFIQYLDRLNSNLPEYIVGHYSINDMLKYVLILFTGVKRNDRVKRFNDFIEPEVLRSNYRKIEGKLAFNVRYVRMAMGIESQGYSREEALKLRASVEEFVDSIRENDIVLKFGSNTLHMSDSKDRVLEIRSKYFHEIGVL